MRRALPQLFSVRRRLKEGEKSREQSTQWQNSHPIQHAAIAASQRGRKEKDMQEGEVCNTAAMTRRQVKGRRAGNGWYGMF